MPRRPSYRRGIRRGQIGNWPEGAGTPEEVAQHVTYSGSPLHKTYPSPAGPPAYRSDKAKCWKFAPDQWRELTEFLQKGIRARCVGDFAGQYPERVWVWINDVLHEARLTNPAQGDYHGFPIDDPRQYPVPDELLKAAPRVQIHHA